jgi:hypothetical protein
MGCRRWQMNDVTMNKQIDALVSRMIDAYNSGTIELEQIAIENEYGERISIIVQLVWSRHNLFSVCDHDEKLLLGLDYVIRMLKRYSV